MLGLSLSDSTLNTCFVITFTVTLGHEHYYLRYCETDGDLSLDKHDVEILANFNVYAVATLHLAKAGIASLGRLLSCCEKD